MLLLLWVSCWLGGRLGQLLLLGLFCWGNLLCLLLGRCGSCGVFVVALLLLLLALLACNGCKALAPLLLSLASTNLQDK